MNRSASEHSPERIRVSLGSAVTIGLIEGKLDSSVTTAYLMTYREGKCNANCGFCPQARQSHSRADMLSRVSWPVFSMRTVVRQIEQATKAGAIGRTCIQALNYPRVFADLCNLIEAIRRESQVPISVSCQPLNSMNVRLLADAGVERLGIPLDAASEQVFDKVKGKSVGGPYDWKRQFELLDEAVSILGRGKVSTHLIVGLGETEKETISVLQKCVEMGVLPALFAFTPIRGTALESAPPPELRDYRRIQIARSLLLYGISKAKDMRFDGKGRLTGFGVSKRALKEHIQRGAPFLTSGCPSCNRPYYNEKPSGPIYNYPRDLTDKEISEIWLQLEMDGA